MAYFAKDMSSPATNNHVVTLDKNGTTMHDMLLSAETDGDIWYFNDYPSIKADTQGHLIVKRDFRVWTAPNGTGPSESYVAMYSPSTGDELGRVDTRFIDSAPTSGFPVNSIGLSDHQLFLKGRNCGDYSCSYGEQDILHAAPLEGLGLDYPRGALIQDNKPPLKKHYVALGDSYSSGEGVEPFLDGTDVVDVNTCHRSQDAYARQLADDIDLKDHFGLAAFRACSGAETDELINASASNNESAQIDYLNKGTDIATLSAGGNDVGFAEYAAACFTVGCTTWEPAITYSIDYTLPDKLDAAYTAIKNKVRNDAKVLAVGYPQLYPEGILPEDIICDLNPTDRLSTRRVVSGLNGQILSATQRAGTQFNFVDPTATNSPFIGHEFCTSQEPYFHHITPSNIEYSFHPKPNGQTAYAQLLKGDFEALLP